MRKRITAVITALVLLLCACGKQSAEEKGDTQQAAQEETVTGQEVRWALQETRFPDADAAIAGLVPEAVSSPSELALHMAGDTIYRISTLRGEGLSALGICIQKLEAPYTEWKNTVILRDEWVEDEYCYAMEAAIGYDGSIDILLQGVDDDTDFHYYMAEWTEEEGMVIRQIPGEYFTEEFFMDTRGYYVDAEHMAYFVTAAGVQYFDETFSEGREWTDTGNVWQITENAANEGEVYLCGGSIEGKFRIWRISGREPIFSSEDVLMNDTDSVVFAGEKEGFLCSTEGIWQFSMETGQLEECLSFYEQGYTVDRIYGVSVTEDGNLRMVAAIDGEAVLLQTVEDESRENKAELELAVILATPFLQEAVVDFNKQSKDCYIVLREPAEDETFADFRTRIQAEVSSGKGPELLADNIIDVTAAARKGLLRNLSEDFAEQRQNMLENVRTVGEVDGESYGIPYCFAVNTVVASADIVGEKESWTAEEMMQYVTESGAKAAIRCYEGSALFSIMTVYGGSGKDLVDWEKGRSCLNSEKTISILEFVGEYGDAEGWENSGVRIAEGEALSTVITVSSMDTAQQMEALFQGKEVYIGFPVEEGEYGNVLLGDTISINQSCEYPQGAVSFIQYLLSEERQNKLAEDACGSVRGSSGFPVYADAIEKMFVCAEKKLEEDYHQEGLLSSYSGYEYVEEPLSRESMEKVRMLLTNAQPAAENMDDICDIIAEETPAYFSGAKTAQEVCDILQNRVQLYLDEIQ